MEFDLEIQHQPGRKTMIADVLSRLRSENVDETEQNGGIREFYNEHLSDISTDSDIVSIVKLLQENENSVPR